MALFECFANFSANLPTDAAKMRIIDVLSSLYYEPDKEKQAVNSLSKDLFLKPSRRLRLTSNKSDHYKPEIQVSAEEAAQGTGVKIRLSLPRGIRNTLWISIAVCLVLAAVFFSGAGDMILDGEMSRNAMGAVFLLTPALVLPIIRISFRANCRIALNSIRKTLGVAEKVKLLSAKQSDWEFFR